MGNRAIAVSKPTPSDISEPLKKSAYIEKNAFGACIACVEKNASIACVEKNASVDVSYKYSLQDLLDMTAENGEDYTCDTSMTDGMNNDVLSMEIVPNEEEWDRICNVYKRRNYKQVMRCLQSSGLTMLV
jgi:hypothetical protein